MKRLMRPSIGVLGRILAVLLLAVLVEFGASTILYERASQFAVREDEARRLAEHLVIARKLLTEGAPVDRPAMASRLSTPRYDVHWSANGRRAPTEPALIEMRDEILAWEPTLADGGLALQRGAGPRPSVSGSLALADGSRLHFGTVLAVIGWGPAIGRIVLALAAALALLLVGGLAIRKLLKPLARLAQAARQIGLGREVMVEETGTVEVRRVVRAFNEMQRRIHSLIAGRTQALAAVGHDLRTPLARLELRLDGIADTAVRDAIAADVGEMEGMVSSLLAFLNGEDDPERPVNIDLAVMAATVVDDAADRGGDATYEGPEHLDKAVRPIGLKRALSNLIENALHYGGSAIVRLIEQADAVEITVEDDGPGIPEAELEAVLEPFTRLDAARRRNTQGLGLGLAIVAQAVEREGGRLTLSNRSEGGLRVSILLPR
ncbi:MAG: ATP-binding protein [Sphingomonas fennica]